MPLTIICRRCTTNVQNGDRFCQECGFDLNPDEHGAVAAVPQKGNQIDFSPESVNSPFDWPALSDDPAAATTRNWSSPAFERKTARALESQSNLAAFDAAPTIESAEEFSASFDDNSVFAIAEELVWNDNAPVSAASESAVKESTATKLHSPLLQKENKVAHKITSRPNSMLTDVALVISLLAFSGALGYQGYKSYFTSQSNNKTKLVQAAQTASQKNEYESAYKSLFALKIMSEKGLDEKQQAVFDEAAFQLGEKALNDGKTKDAVEYFKNISIDSNRYVKAQEIIFEDRNGNAPQKRLSAQSGNSRRTQELTPDTVRNTTSRKSLSPNVAPNNPELALSEEKVLSIPVIPEAENADSKPASESVETIPGVRSAHGLLIEDSPSDASTGASSSASENSYAEAGKITALPGTATDQGKVAEAPTPKFSESEISKYNRLLGRYFAKHSRKSSSTSAAEPPSFKEWLRQGKPSF